MKIRSFFCLLLFASVLLSGAAQAQAQRRGPLVLAAASLQEAMNDAARAWAARRHAAPVLSFAASPALARQIEAGAPADLFVSADEAWMDHVAGKGLLRPGSRADFLTNRLVLVAPARSAVALRIARGFPLARALGKGRLAMADPDAVPAGKYGKAALAALGVWRSVEARVARAENVRAALALVERGAAPLGVVYETDARASSGVRIVGVFPSGTHPPIVYPLAILRGSRHPEVEDFRRFLLSREGKAIFARRGFPVR
ncbi:molybdate ABC transporter substrate binding protein precursor [Sphingobium sp. SYK-6]|nr:molybdate ABC transporter substrate binding protein precursor [Sphingobium sp. SYK-6]